MPSSDDGWAVTYDGTIRRWNGVDWLEVPRVTHAWLNSVAMVSSGDGWAVGRLGSVVRWKWEGQSAYLPVTGGR